ncbi:MAG: hemin uptake protein HemP [Candidatus Thiodiazotropha sp. (ex Lucina aurantia)]|nr:hemin uptake protein HemP [Candidatus Thiodiazotropha taylori]MBT3030425.1 hemin uptake protein HemP [Candidatus Thiodiazotropha sp. (ex Lucina pensylvanica)]MBT3051469.1 hemin uptake protein HemP [Candidatus Thiodiazotropha sp. (ex Codakia orbicularis)]MBV2102988.1 hemin uptake protein HemP [Candidatus Thiodiazotropha sp. (ex Lucina aurantia)]MBT3054615.1 hemin uptake protein HemP [Candidatus Thiodiazotropha sp. (ex Codakia orbicularis)]
MPILQKTAPSKEELRLSSSMLFQGHNRLLIEHQGCEYRLQITRQGKLILTK